MSILDFFSHRPRVMFFVSFLLFVVGVSTYSSIPKESFPAIKIPTFYVSVNQRSLSPKDVETLIVKPLESEYLRISGIKHVTSYASKGRAAVIAEFSAGFDSDRALYDIKNATDRAKSKFPEDALEPDINELDFSKFPVLNIVLSGDLPERVFYNASKELEKRIERLNEVNSVEIVGASEEVVEVSFEPESIERYNISMGDLVRIAEMNRSVSVGKILNSGALFSIDAKGVFNNIQDIQSVPMKAQEDEIIMLSDIATINRTYKDPSSFVSVNGKKAVVLEVSKKAGRNTIITIQKVRDTVNAAKSHLPSGLIVSFSRDTSEDIMESVSNLNNNIILAIIVVTLVIILMVGLREGLYILPIIPLSFLLTIVTLHALGFSLNMVTLFSLILGTGLIVDMAIVVVEYGEMVTATGAKKSEALLVSAKKMFIPLLTSTITTLIATMPLMFWPGLIGKFMRLLPVTLFILLASSLLCTLVLMPVIGRVFASLSLSSLRHHQSQESQASLKPTHHKAQQFNLESIKTLSMEELKGMNGLLGWYASSVASALKKPGKQALYLLGAVISMVIIFVIINRGVTFFPYVEQDNAQLIVRAFGNLSLEQKSEIVKAIEAKVWEVHKERGEVKNIYSRASTGMMRDSGGGKYPADTIAVIDIEFVNWQKRRSIKELMTIIGKSARGVPGVVVDTQLQRDGPPAAKDLVLQVKSSDDILRNKFIDAIHDKIDESGKFTNVSDSRSIPRIEYSIDIDRAKLAMYQIPLDSIQTFLMSSTDGFLITKFTPPDSRDEIDIVFRFPEEYRNIDYISSLKVPTQNLGQNGMQSYIPLQNVASIGYQSEVQEIKRFDGDKVTTISADVKDKKIARQVIEGMDSWLQAYVPPGVRYEFGGDKEMEAETGAFLGRAFLLTIFLMILILLFEFNSFIQVGITMLMIFLSFVGVLFTTALFGQQFSIVMSGLAIVALIGISVNDIILFMEAFNELRRDRFSELGMPSSDRSARYFTEITLCLAKAIIIRAKPIVITTVTTVLGIMPMIFKLSINFLESSLSIGAPSANMWIQVSVAIFGGLTMVSALTLFCVPSLVLLCLRWKEGFRKKILQFLSFVLSPKMRN